MKEVLKIQNEEINANYKKKQNLSKQQEQIYFKRSVKIRNAMFVELFLNVVKQRNLASLNVLYSLHNTECIKNLGRK